MTERARQARESTARLREALERTAGALATADLQALLESEVDLAVAVARVTPPRTLEPSERAALTSEIEGVRQALARCRRLGGALQDVVRVSLEAQGRTTAYGRRDAGTLPAPRRVHSTG
jgi:hypothetical protein